MSIAEIYFIISGVIMILLIIYTRTYLKNIYKSRIRVIREMMEFAGIGYQIHSNIVIIGLNGKCKAVDFMDLYGASNAIRKIHNEKKFTKKQVVEIIFGL